MVVSQTTMQLAILSVLFWALSTAAHQTSQRHSGTNSTNDGIHLALLPKCGSKPKYPTANVSNINAGLLPLSSYKTIVTFGDSYTSGGVDNGSTLAPAVVIPPNPKAGGRTTNGPVWIEDISTDTGALFKDYAVSKFHTGRLWRMFLTGLEVGGAVTNKTLWPSKANASDFVGQGE